MSTLKQESGPFTFLKNSDATVEVVNVKFLDDLHLRKCLNQNLHPNYNSEQEYLVNAAYRVDVTLKLTHGRNDPNPAFHTELCTVPEGMLTDLASVPRALRWLVGRVGPHLEAAIVHDYMFSFWSGKFTKRIEKKYWKLANKIFLKAMEVRGTKCITRYSAYLAVASFFGWIGWKNAHGMVIWYEPYGTSDNADD